MRQHGFGAAGLVAAAVGSVGIAVTVLLLPETEGKRLEDVTAEAA